MKHTVISERTRSHTWARLRLLLGDRPVLIASLVLVSVVAGLMESVILTVVAQAAAALVDGARRVHVGVGPLHADASLSTLLAFAFGIAVLRLALMVPASILPARMATTVQARLRRDLFRAFTYASWEVQARDREGHLQELMTNQVGQATGAALQVAQCLTAIITLAMLLLSALVLNALGAVFVLAAALLLFGLLRPLNDRAARHSHALSQAQMDYAHGVSEATRLAEETYTFGVADGQRRRIDHTINSTRDLFFRTQLLSNLVPNVYRGFIYLLIVAGLAALNLTHAGHVASLGAVVILLVRAGGYGQAAQGAYIAARQAMPYVERVQEAEHRYAASALASGGRALQAVDSLAFDRVSFAYVPGRVVLSNISFAVEAGEAVGIIGPSGAGKSTLVQILLRLRSPQSGQYLVNGTPASELARSDWHTRVAYVPQEPRLLHASVRDNIRYFRDVTDADVERAAALARIDADIETWAQGYDTIIGPRADAVSGGQQQRICIARALAGRPEVLVLDEPTSALDPRSEGLLQESLAALKETLTLVIIAHRMTTLTICDRIMVIVDGRLEAFDSAANLGRLSEYYRSTSALALGTGPKGAR